jgi:TonB family protein
MSTVKKSEVYGVIGTIIINGLIILLLFLFGMSMDPPFKPDPGIEISFGDGLDGAPAEEIASIPATAEPVPTPPVEETNPPQQLTQEDPSIAIEADKKRKEEKRKKEEIRLEQIRQQKILQEQQAKAAREKAIADAKAAQSAKANALAKGAFGGGGNNASGNGPGGGGQGSTPGNPLGRGTSGGNSWSLEGRDLNSAFYKPPYVGDQEGKIVVGITVDKNGTVIATSIKQGTTISEENLREECKKAARKLKFSPTNKAGNAMGEIVYRFSQQ